MRAHPGMDAPNCGSEPAREKPEGVEVNQTSRVIVVVHREQARSYRGATADRRAIHALHPQAEWRCSSGDWRTYLWERACSRKT
ncbi:hypothetical protein D3C80_1757590 [compost metagenome]